MNFKTAIYSVLITLFVSICSNSSATDTSKFPYVGVVNSQKVDVLPEKSDNVREIATLSQNDLVTVLNQDGKWLEIKAPESIACWVSKDYIVDGKISGNMVNIRQGAGTNYPVIAQLNRGEKATIIQEKTINEIEKWCQIAPPESIKTWVNASGISYFSSIENLSSELSKLENGKQILDAAILSAETELSKNNYKEIDFDTLKNKFYKLILDYPDTSSAKKALETLSKIQDEEIRMKAEYDKSVASSTARDTFFKAESQMRSDFEQPGIQNIDSASLNDLYLSVIKTAPSSQEAVSSIERLALIKKKFGSIKDELRTKRVSMLEEAEKYQKMELSKSSNIDYDSINQRYSYLINSYPDTLEAKKAKDKINYVNRLRSLGKYKIAGEDNSYAFEGHLVKRGISRNSIIYEIEERGLFGYKKVICEFKTDNQQVKNYTDKKVKVYGAIISFKGDVPVVDLVKLELR